MAQVSWGMIACMEVSGELPIHIYEFTANARAQKRLINAVSTFWGYVEAGQPPQPDYTRDLDTIKNVNASENGDTIDLSGNNRMPLLCQRMKEIEAQLRELRALEKEKRAIEAEIRDALKQASRATLNGFEIETKTVERKGHIVEPTKFRTIKVSEEGNKR